MYVYGNIKETHNPINFSRQTDLHENLIQLNQSFSGALFEYSVILLRMKIKTIRQIRKCLNGNLAAYLAPLANPLGANMANGSACAPSQNQGFQGEQIQSLAQTRAQ